MNSALQPPPRRPRYVAYLAGGLITTATVFAGGTFAYLSQYESVTAAADSSGLFVRAVLSQLSLQGENVLAAWFSSMLLLLASSAAVLCFATDRRATRGRALLSFGWLFLAAVFLLLSLDELGSLHERLGALELSTPGSTDQTPRGWVALLTVPIAIVAAYMAAFAWFRLRRCVPAFLLMVAGVLLFLTVPAQEVLELSLFSHSGSSRRPPVLSVLEEGTELAGTICFVLAFLLYATRVPAAPALQPVRESSHALSHTAWRLCLVGYALFMAVGLAASLATSPRHKPSSPGALWAASSFNGALAALDIDLAVALATNDFELRILPSPSGEPNVYAGRSSLRGWLQQSRAQDLRIHQTSLTPNGDTFVWLGRATQPSWAQQGIGTLRTETTVHVRDGKVDSLTLYLGAPPNEVMGNAFNWFPSAAASVTALLAASALATKRATWPPVRAGLTSVALACLALSAYIGSNGPAYLTGDAGITPRLIAECVRGAIVVAAAVLSLGRTSIAEIASLVGGAVIVGLGIGLGGAYTQTAVLLGMLLVGAVVSRIALDVEPGVLTPTGVSAPSPAALPAHAEASAARA